jgi:Caspase domain
MMNKRHAVLIHHSAFTIHYSFSSCPSLLINRFAMRTFVSILAVMLFAAGLIWPGRGSGASAVLLDESERRKPFALELPEIGPQAITAPEVTIPHANLSRVRLRVYKPFADRIRYGKIYTRINGESANTVFNFNSGSDGYIINGNLESKPRFRLRPGKNVVEIIAREDAGREYYASYVLLTADRRTESADSASDATVESLPVAAGDDRLPPTIYLTQPAGAPRLTGDAGTFKVAGVVMDNRAVASVTVNGQPAKLTPAAATRGLNVAPSVEAVESAEALKNAQEFELSATVGADVAALVVEARDGAGNLSRLSLPVRRREAAVSATFKGRKFALVVGVSKYKFKERGLTDLAYADADARAVRDFLQRPEGGGFAPADILLLENEQATIESLRATLNAFLPKAGPGDLFFIFLAAHGSPDPDAPQNLYFILHDTRPADMPNTALPMNELQEALEHKVRAERLVVFVDTCHSAGLSGEALVATRGVENNLINLYASRLFNEAGRAVLTSADVNELSREGPRWGGGHGVFTWAILEGLRGAADANEDRFVTAGELFAYVRNRVRFETGFRQNPRALPGLNTDLSLAFVGKR